MSRDILDYGDICDACGRKQRPDDSRVFLHVAVGGRVMVLCSGCRQESRQWASNVPAAEPDHEFTFADYVALACVFGVSAVLAAAVILFAMGGKP